MQDQEEETNRLRSAKSYLEKEQLRITTENEKLRAQNAELVEKTKGKEQDLSEQIKKQNEKTDAKLEVMISDHNYEMKQKDNKVKELQQQMALMVRQNQKQTEGFREELEQARDQLSMMHNNEAVIEVYKKKLDSMAELKTDLADAHDLNQKL